MKNSIAFYLIGIVFLTGCSTFTRSSVNPSRLVAQERATSLLIMCYGANDKETCIRGGSEIISQNTSCLLTEAKISSEICQYDPPRSVSAPQFNGGTLQTEFQGVLYCQIPTQNCLDGKEFQETEYSCPAGFQLKQRRKSDDEAKKSAWVSSAYCEHM